ncbi:unnamed protein product [Moneuplotes crassus]|uniref:Poly(A) RNA polymerase mitochondrial-like central palm domain-containing protein n=2 Tax=Euplotes crassus TaxID=5936 RepID=A0AAD1XJE9_EUPCR|nr:unnamed protein product [Moneuplotes crassus]
MEKDLNATNKAHFDEIKDLYDKADWLALMEYCTENEPSDLIRDDTKFQNLLIRIMETLLKNSLGNDTQDCYKYILSLLLCSLSLEKERSRRIIGNLFLDACGSSQLELIKEFFTDHETELINIKFCDPDGRSCFHYAADGNGDNYDVIEFILHSFAHKDNYFVTKGLLYFLSKKSLINSKPNSIKEFFKKIEYLDLSQKDVSGNSALHLIMLNCEDAEIWKETILQIIERNPSLYCMKNNEGKSPKFIDSEKSLGISEMIDENSKSKNESKPAKSQKTKNNSLKTASLSKKDDPSREELSPGEEAKSPSKGGEKKTKNKDRKSKKDKPNSKESSGSKQKAHNPNQSAKNVQKEVKEKSQKDQKGKKEKAAQNKQNPQIESKSSQSKKKDHIFKFNREANEESFPPLVSQSNMKNPDRELKVEDTVEVPGPMKENLNKPPSPNVKLEETQKENKTDHQNLVHNEMMNQYQNYPQYQMFNQNNPAGMIPANVNPQNMGMMNLYPAMAQNQMQPMPVQNLQPQMLNAQPNENAVQKNQKEHNSVDQMNSHGQSLPTQQPSKSTEKDNTAASQSLQNNLGRGDRTTGSKKPESQHSVPTYKVDLSTKKKITQFKDERLDKAYDRLSPFLNKQDKDDLKFSVKGLRRLTLKRAKHRKEQKEEECKIYFRRHHRVSLKQSVNMFKEISEFLKANPEADIKNNESLLEHLKSTVNDVLFKKNPDEPHNIEENVKQDGFEQTFHYENPQMYMNNYPYNQEFSQMNQIIPNFREDVDQFLKSVLQKKHDMYKSRENIIQKVKLLVEEVPNIESIEIYGSFKTNLDLPWSDIDFVAFSDLFDGSRCLDELHTRLQDEVEKDSWITKIDYISSASVPIIKLNTIDNDFEIKVDITFGDQDHKGSQCVQLVKDYLSFYPILGYIVMIIKQILKINSLNDPYSGGISSYGITLMIVAFLQFQKLHCIGPYGQLGYYETYRMNHNDLGCTVFQFLHFYGYFFDFQKWDIRPQLEEGGMIGLGCEPIVDNQWPDEKLNIFDPLNASNNVGKSSFKIEEIKECFKECADIISPILFSYQQFEMNGFYYHDVVIESKYNEWKTRLFDF